MSHDTNQEIKLLKAQLRGMNILLKQNAQLEREVSRLCGELEQVSVGVQKKGYLYKWREREISYASRWGLRYFVLNGHTLCYYSDDHATHPRGTYDLRQCFVRDEGIKGGQHYIFSVYMGAQDAEVAEESTESDPSDLLVIRMSSDSSAEAKLWISMLELACAMDVGRGDADDAAAVLTLIGSDPHDSRDVATTTTASQQPTLSASNIMAIKGEKSSNDPSDASGNDWSTGDAANERDREVELVPGGEEVAQLPRGMLTRVQSASQVLKRSQSKGALQRQLSAMNEHENNKPDEDAPPSQSPAAGSLTVKTPSAAEGSTNNLPNSSKANNHQKKSTTKHHKAFPGYKPIHIEAKHSPLSSEARPGEHNFRGFFNLAVIILVLSHMGLVVNNMRSYGSKFWGMPTFESYGILTLDNFKPALFSLAQWCASILFALSVEKLVVRRVIANSVAKFLNVLAGTVNLVMPCYYVWTNTGVGPFSNMTYLFQSVIIWMKLISYAHANSDLRTLNKRLKLGNTPGPSSPSTPRPSSDRLSSLSGSGSRGGGSLERSPSGTTMMSTMSVADNLQSMFNEVKDVRGAFLLYPQNITLGNIFYFALAPTLCYQLNYPRTKRIRLRYLATILFRLALCSVMIIYTVQQYIKPTLETSLEAMHSKNIVDILEALLHLTIPNSYVWLLIFYWFFHLWLNMLAELTCFGDRQFYKDWWNARTIDRYWRTWNMPVHNWITRHLYYPLIRLGVSKFISTFLVFFFSAALHELIIATPFRYIALHAFAGMMFQAPLIYITKVIDRRFENAVLGNCFFWMVFCVLGQPMGVLMYNYDLWRLENTVPVVAAVCTAAVNGVC